MPDSKIEMVFEVLSDLRGYSGVGLDGNPYDTLSWNAALMAVKEVISYRLHCMTGERNHD